MKKGGKLLLEHILINASLYIIAAAVLIPLFFLIYLQDQILPAKVLILLYLFGLINEQDIQ